MEVLLGAKKTLASEQCILINIEVESYPHFSGQALATEINEILSVYKFAPVLADCEYHDQFNVVYIKKDFLDKISEDLRYSWLDLRQINFSSYDFLHSFASNFKIIWLFSFAKKIALKVFGYEAGHKIAAKFGSKSSQRITQIKEK